MNRNNFYNKSINDIHWFIVLKNFPVGTTEKELYKAIQKPYPPKTVMMDFRDSYRALAYYNNMKDVSFLI